MFTGLVAGRGHITAADRSDDGIRLTVQTSLAGELALGDSVAVNGVCLTAVTIDGDAFAADVMNETLARSSLSDALVGKDVNECVNLRIDPLQASETTLNRLATADLTSSNGASKLASTPLPGRAVHRFLKFFRSDHGPNGLSRSRRALASWATLKSNNCSRETFFSTKLKYLLLQKSCIAIMESTGGIPSSLR